MKARPEAEARSKRHSGVANKISDPGEVLQRWGFGRVRRWVVGWGGWGGCQTETDLLKLTERKARARERRLRENNEREGEGEREGGEEKEGERGQERKRKRGGEERERGV